MANMGGDGSLPLPFDGLQFSGVTLFKLKNFVWQENVDLLNKFQMLINFLEQRLALNMCDENFFNGGTGAKTQVKLSLFSVYNPERLFCFKKTIMKNINW